MKKYLPMLICGFGAGVLSIVPVIKSLSCCLVIPFAAGLSLFLDQKASNNYNKIAPGKAAFSGAFTGIFAAVFSTAFTILMVFLTRTSDINESLGEFRKYLSSIPTPGIANEVINIMTKMADEISTNGFSVLFTFSIFTSSLFIDIIFGIIGGLVGMQIINNRRESNL